MYIFTFIEVVKMLCRLNVALFQLVFQAFCSYTCPIIVKT